MFRGFSKSYKNRISKTNFGLFWGSINEDSHIIILRFIECFICEQNMIGVGIGVACRDRTVAFASTFAAFLTRAFDNLRMGVISQTNLNVVGSHAGWRFLINYFTIYSLFQEGCIFFRIVEDLGGKCTFLHKFSHKIIYFPQFQRIKPPNFFFLTCGEKWFLRGAWGGKDLKRCFRYHKK